MRQIAMVIDLNKCIGCQTCTMACKTQWTIGKGRDYMYWMNVETMPGKGYPRGYMDMNAGFDKNKEVRKGPLPSNKDYGKPWEFNYKEFMEGRDKVVKTKEVPAWGPGWDEEVGSGDYPNNYYFYLPRLCNQKCRGYRHCVRACPYKKAYFNPSINKTEKCIFCFPRLENGKAQACARQCVGRVRHVGYLDDKNSHVYRLVKKWEVALPLRPDFGTLPNVYYIPPFSPPKLNENGEVSDKPRIPVEHLRKLFGPRLDNALKTLQTEMDKRSKGEKSELTDILIAYRHKEMFSL
jgi:complex iron-sulfur molybdoenzyme family reductase subunit beta